MGTSGWLVISALVFSGFLVCFWFFVWFGGFFCLFIFGVFLVLLGVFWGVFWLFVLGVFFVCHDNPVRILIKTKKQENPKKTRQKIPQTQNTAKSENETNL